MRLVGLSFDDVFERPEKDFVATKTRKREASARKKDRDAYACGAVVTGAGANSGSRRHNTAAV
jgi:hypothetical protein